jgi:hypothetical protein
LTILWADPLPFPIAIAVSIAFAVAIAVTMAITNASSSHCLPLLSSASPLTIVAARFNSCLVTFTLSLGEYLV